MKYKKLLNKKAIVLHIVTLVFLFGIFSSRKALGQTNNVINIDSTVNYQTISGWEAMAYASDWPLHNEGYPQYMNEILDIAAFDLGINRLRVEIGRGAENPVDYWSQFESGQIDEIQYVHDPAYRGTTVNDNEDPYSINLAGFNFQELDHQMDVIVMPMKQRLQSIGEDVHINILFVNGRNGNPELHANNPEEYAEFVLATYQHLDNKYRVVPDTWEIVNEPDNSKPYWNANNIAQSIIASGSRLEANGYNPKISAPSSLSLSTAIIWFGQMIQVQGVSQYLSEIAYHRYGGSTISQMQDIAKRATSNSIDTAMLEHMGSSYHNLHEDLKIARNSAWSGAYGIAGNYAHHDYYRIDSTDPNNPVIIMNEFTKLIRQYTKFIRAGAQRIEAEINGCRGDEICTSNFDPLAFINTDGKYAVVVKADSGGGFLISGLPAGTYGIKYTTGNGSNAPTAYDVNLPDETISAGQLLTSSIPSRGVITIYQKPSGTPSATLTPSPVGGSGDANGDDRVDITDYLIWVEQYGNYNPTPNSDPDFNNDGKVDGEDYAIWMNDFGN